MVICWEDGAPSVVYHLMIQASSRGAAEQACVVTGGAGFVGSAVVRWALRQGYRVLVVDDLSSGKLERLPMAHGHLELRRQDAAGAGVLAAALTDSGATRLLHLAGPVGVRRVLSDPGAAEAQILALGRAVIAELASLPSPRPRLFAASTSEVYAEQLGPMGEDSPLRAPGGAARWCYALAKRACEERFDRSGLWPEARGPVHLRLFNVVGPGQDADGGMVLPTFLTHALAGRPLPVHGDGRQERTYGYIDDVAADIGRLVFELDAPPGALNLGGSAAASATELAELVLRTVAAEGGPRGQLRRVDPAALMEGFAEVQRREPNLARARALGLGESCRSLNAIVEGTLAALLPGRKLPCASPGS